MAKEKTTQVKRKKISLETREQIQKLTLMNNAFMNLALENNIPCVEEMSRVILGKSDLTVKKVQTPSDILSYLLQLVSCRGLSVPLRRVSVRWRLYNKVGKRKSTGGKRNERRQT